jgi:hypothetical protein
MSDFKKSDPDVHSAPLDDEEPLALTVDWTHDEEKRAKRK